ncbi:BTAD domain-containing putative transcriptional regulator [Streptomyces sp. DSM 44915]|uniref:BTAD domain-containing putative transcriptional regulator n=1 Tax=Streptomyces chisholmiae TaxID=3075540 RepID=A0ABU2JVX2_9ACTN|nr:BTAD domain-containing putative transcriptional regulator [Streptomyces sp. DSM 44915]MDT0269142.1 BTAD domain-containing putative transcriptional regulator [Streptomyces sp. DSM 44915]
MTLTSTSPHRAGFTTLPDAGSPVPGPPRALHLGILGPLQARFGDRTLRIGGPRQRAVLATLLLAPDRVTPVDTLLDQVWGGQPPQTGRAQIRICVASLRQLFRNAGVRQDVIVTAAPGYQLVSEPHRVDSLEFGQAVDRAEAAHRAGDALGAVRLLRGALALWRGTALGGVNAPLAEVEAARLEEQRLLITERFMELRLRTGESGSLLTELGALVLANPLRERLRGHLMLAQHRSGHRMEALRTFREGRDLCVREMGLEPGNELQQLHQLILSDSPRLLPRGQDRDRIEVQRPAQLPSGIPAFAGREPELRALDSLFASRRAHGPVPIGLLVGRPGVGKSALAVHWAHRAADRFPDGVLYADLRENGAPVPVATVLRRFLHALGARPERIGHDHPENEVLYRSLLGDRRVLVVLDNVDAAPRLRSLLPGNGRCCAVLTARSWPRGLADTSPLRVSLGPLRPAESVAVLRGVLRDDRLADQRTAERLAELCDHHPLALHAAGARLADKPHWTVRQFETRLTDPGRRLAELSHGEDGLAARLDAVYRTLPPDTARAYRLLSTAGPGALDLPTATRLLGLGPLEAEEEIERLVDAQLLHPVRQDSHPEGAERPEDPEGAGDAGDAADPAPRYRYPELTRLHALQLRDAWPGQPTDTEAMHGR